jgi:hypothetical protein
LGELIERERVLFPESSGDDVGVDGVVYRFVVAATGGHGSLVPDTGPIEAAVTARAQYDGALLLHGGTVRAFSVILGRERALLRIAELEGDAISREALEYEGGVLFDGDGRYARVYLGGSWRNVAS